MLSVEATNNKHDVFDELEHCSIDLASCVVLSSCG